jgi:hypothetical protein
MAGTHFPSYLQSTIICRKIAVVRWRTKKNKKKRERNKRGCINRGWFKPLIQVEHHQNPFHPNIGPPQTQVLTAVGGAKEIDMEADKEQGREDYIQ